MAAGRSCAGPKRDHVQGPRHRVPHRAENPYNNFLPEAGRITTLAEPTGPGVRLESGIYAGWEVSLYYDPLLAKLVVWGETRPEAILRMRRALDEYRVGGIHTTIPFHQQVMDSTALPVGPVRHELSSTGRTASMTAAPGRDLAQVAASPRRWSSTKATAGGGLRAAVRR